jgi:MFS family permease
MRLSPQKTLTPKEIAFGLKYTLHEGLFSEAMTTLTSSTFLVAMAILLDATNLQIGLLAALPTLTNIFQLLSIWAVKKYNNRRAISVICSVLARTPLVIIGIITILPGELHIDIVIFFLFFYYVFASISGPSWNSWMKDLVPENTLATYFAKRSGNNQVLNVVMGLGLAFILDYVKKNFPGQELNTYGIFLLAAGITGLSGVLLLSKVPEPQSTLANENIFRLFKRPLEDRNFKRLMVFNSIWVFALSIATPFFTVFMMKSMGLSVSYIIGLTITSQLSTIFTVRIWGKYADRYSNKTIIAISAPIYILVMIAWCFVGIYSALYANLILLVIIHIVTGISTAGINLSLTNIGLKLAPANYSIVYLSVKNIITAIFSSLGPLVGGVLADYFNKRSLTINAEYIGPKMNKVFHVLSLHEFNFLFLIGAFLAFIAIEFLVAVKETGEVEKDVVMKMMRSNLKSNLKEYYLIGHFVSWHEQFWDLLKKKTSPEDVAHKTRTE